MINHLYKVLISNSFLTVITSSSDISISIIHVVISSCLWICEFLSNVTFRRSRACIDFGWADNRFCLIFDDWTEDYLEVFRDTFERDGAVLNMTDTHSRTNVGYIVQLGCDLGVGRHNCCYSPGSSTQSVVCKLFHLRQTAQGQLLLRKSGKDGNIIFFQFFNQILHKVLWMQDFCS